MVQELAQVAATRALDEQDSLRLALGAGIRLLTAEQALRVPSAVGGHPGEEVDRFLRRRIELEGEHAVLKHRLRLALQDNQAMPLREGALTATIAGLERLVERLRAEVAGSRHRTQATSHEGPVTPPTPLLLLRRADKGAGAILSVGCSTETHTEGASVVARAERSWRCQCEPPS